MTDARYLLDTGICLYHLPGGSRELGLPIGMRIGEVGTSSICTAESRLGHRRSAGREALAAAEAFFGKVRVLPFDRGAAEACGALPFRRARFDGLIAAHAVAPGAVLVSNDVGAFSDIPGLLVENRAP